MWFGRSRVQDRAGDSDERGAMDDPTAARNDSTAGLSTGRAATLDGGSTSSVLARPIALGACRLRRPRPRRDARQRRAIDALRAATTAAGESRAAVARRRSRRFDRLHDMRLEAEHRSRRALAASRARGASCRTRSLRRPPRCACRLRFVRSVRRGLRRRPHRSDASAESATRRSRAFSELLTELGVDPQRRSPAGRERVPHDARSARSTGPGDARHAIPTTSESSSTRRRRSRQRPPRAVDGSTPSTSS